MPELVFLNSLKIVYFYTSIGVDQEKQTLLVKRIVLYQVVVKSGGWQRNEFVTISAESLIGGVGFFLHLNPESSSYKFFDRIYAEVVDKSIKILRICVSVGWFGKKVV